MEDFKEIDVQQAKELMGQGNVTIVDIRTEDVFKEGYIPDAVHINDDNLEEFVQSADKKKPLLCYCNIGFSSKGASQYFIEQGFETVFSLMGGFIGWQEANELVRGAENE